MASKRRDHHSSQKQRRNARGRARWHRRPKLDRVAVEQLEPRLVLSADSAAGGLDPALYAAGTILVKLREAPRSLGGFTASSASLQTSPTGTVSSTLSSFPSTLTSLLDTAGVSGGRRVFPTVPTPGTLTLNNASVASSSSLSSGGAGVTSDARTVGLDRWYSFNVPAGTSVDQLLASLRADATVEAAEPDFLFRLSGIADGQSSAAAAGGGGAGVSSLPSSAGDPAYGQQWHLGAVKAPEAWAHLESLGLPAGGRSDIVVAVIDTGVDYTHPDLAANMWVNTREIAGNNLDDDANGFRNDIHGVSVVSNSSSHTGNPMDDNGHGTHVAGIIAAAANNGIGGTGIAYNAKIMAIKAFQYSGVGASTDIAEAIYYAVENGADIINMSFGSYSESSLVKDALQVAFGTSVLVAAAGNDGRGNLSCPPTDVPPPANMYPAAYNWVLGVMASSPMPNLLSGWRAPFSNKDCLPNDAHEYEILAPGASVYSTLPGATYSAWSGTSMAAPVVSGIAALLRTKFADKALYSSRFIMGQLAVGRGENPLGYVINAQRALTDTPRPNLTYRNHFLFDTTAQAAGNDADGRIDAGETVNLAVTIRNHWGKADNVTVKLDAFAAGAVGPDPYVTIITDTVNYGAVGTFNEDDNGLIYNSGGIVTGVTSPFRLSVSANTPNDHVIPFRLTITATNGLDPADQTVYSFTSRFTMTVQRGRELPSIIADDMVLTKDHLWLVTRPVLVQAGKTLTIEAGTKVQWGLPSSSQVNVFKAPPYIYVEGTLRAVGTAEDPVQLFPSDLFNETYEHPETNGIVYGSLVRIYNVGTATLDFTHVLGPSLGGPHGRGQLTSISRSYLYGDGTGRANVSIEGGGSWSGTGMQLAAASITETRIDLSGIHYYPWALNDPNSPAHLSFDTVLVDRISPMRTGLAGAASRSVFLGANSTNSRLTLTRGVYDTRAEALVAQDQISNAFLNPLWRTDASSWLAIQSPALQSKFINLVGNFWGTDNEQLINAMLVDSVDSFHRATFVLGEPRSSVSETTYPYVVSAILRDDGNNVASSIATGMHSFTVTFNRDMDMTAQPQVGFGAAAPYTDHTVVGDWVDARTWRGTYNVTPLTGDGYQLIRVAGAQAADKPWLVTGNDAGRFRFEIVTSGTQSMNLQASGGEAKVDLSWTQDDFDLLAGYNIYRSTTANGTYTRVNSTVIPKEQTTFTDRSVQPAQTYFYKFRIVKTDSTESVDSNVAAAAPLDTIPPVISHTALTSAVPNFAVTIRADVTDNLAVQGVTLHYRAIGQTAYQTRPMTLTTGARYTASLDAPTMTAPGVEYYISATDGVTTVYQGLAAQPHRITVVDRPVVTTITPSSGPSTGGTSVTIVGSNFKVGASVTIGGAVASNVTVVSATQITATTPAGVPSYADVRVINPGDAVGTLLGGFRYVAQGVLVSVPTLTAESGGTVDVPISVADVNGLLSGALTLSFDPAVLQPTASRVGPLTAGWALAANTATPGQVRLTLAGATSISATGVVAYVSFNVVGGPNTSSALSLSSVSLNDGAIASQTAAGQLAVNDLHAISGLVRYYADNTAIAGVALFLEGEASLTMTTGSTGAYSFADLRAGNYTLMPDKQSDVRQITAYDAALVLQAAAGMRTLSANETLAADTNRRDGVTALDASYILQKSVGLIPGTFPNAGTHWVFSPSQRTFTNLAADQLNQHFTGILLGDVSGNWSQGDGGAGVAGTSGVLTGSSRLSIGAAAAAPGETGVRVPVRIERGGPGVYAADLTITYDPTALSLASGGVSLGTAATGMAFAVNAATPGVIRVGLAGTQPIATDGDLIALDFNVAPDRLGDQPLSFSVAKLNEGQAGVTSNGGAITVTPTVMIAEGQQVSDSETRSGNQRILKQGAGTLVLDRANSHAGGTRIESGQVVVRHASALGSGVLEVLPGARITLDVDFSRVTVSNLVVHAGATIDIGRGGIVLPTGTLSPSEVRTLLVSGRNGGTWNGSGISSSDGVSGSRRAVGYRVMPDNSIVVAWAAFGDTNLDGRVNSTDINMILSAGRYGTTATDGGWWQGDFNYDGRANTSDINLLISAGLLNAPSYRTTLSGQSLQASASANAMVMAAFGLTEPPSETMMDAASQGSVMGQVVAAGSIDPNQYPVVIQGANVSAGSGAGRIDEIASPAAVPPPAAGQPEASAAPVLAATEVLTLAPEQRTVRTTAAARGRAARSGPVPASGPIRPAPEPRNPVPGPAPAAVLATVGVGSVPAAARLGTSAAVVQAISSRRPAVARAEGTEARLIAWGNLGRPGEISRDLQGSPERASAGPLWQRLIFFKRGAR
jgi:autotransporter-associated beta strand protein